MGLSFVMGVDQDEECGKEVEEGAVGVEKGVWERRERDSFLWEGW